MPYNKAGGRTAIGLIAVAIAVFATGTLAFMAFAANM
jgi:hypothetical protein